MPEKHPLPDVQIGQLWEDTDKRMAPRKLRVVRVEGEFAFMEDLSFPRLQTKIKIRRMKPGATGYRRVS